MADNVLETSNFDVATTRLMEGRPVRYTGPHALAFLNEARRIQARAPRAARKRGVAPPG
jgi:hypothetical protein